MFKIIDRYILLELIEPFLFGLVSFTLILSASMVMFDLVRAVVIGGMPLWIALQLLIYKLPGIIVYIFPMATLLAVLLSFARLSGDSEIIAFKAGGVSLYRIMMPVMLLGIAVSLVTMVFYEIIVPKSNRWVQELTLQTHIQKTIRMRDNVFVPEIKDGQLQRIFYARRIPGEVMEGGIVQEFVDGRLSELINAKSAQWADDKWKFSDGVIYLLSETGEYKHLIKFEEQVIAIKYKPSDFYVEESKPEEMNYKELKEYIGLKQKMGANVTDLNIQLNLKIAIPFASFVFALLGAPLWLNPTRRSSSIGLGLSIIIIFFYYVLMFFSMSAGELEIVSPFWAAWLPNVIAAGAGGYILHKAAN